MNFNPDNLETIVVKIGTTLLSGQRAFEGQVMEAVVKDICRIKHDHDVNVIIVTSGAVGCGMNALSMTVRPTLLPLKQAVAAVGQATLMHYYETLFLTYGDGLRTAQVLLTLADLDNRKTYLNVRNTLNTLLEMKNIVPIINENDSTAVDELRFGDNDTLAARIAVKLGAGLLIILSDVDGLFDKNPAEHADARLLERVDTITPEIEAAAGGAGSIRGTGGMRTKLTAARMACAAGVPVAIANGHHPEAVSGVLSGAFPYTCFAPALESMPQRKRWIAFGRAVQGVIHIDEGASAALREKGKSLLPAGVREVSGDFEAGDAVAICGPGGATLAQALVNYSSADIRRIMGRRSQEIPSLLGRPGLQEVAHRDNMVLL